MEPGQLGTKTLICLRDRQFLAKVHTPEVTMEGKTHVFGLNFNSAYEFGIVPVIES